MFNFINIFEYLFDNFEQDKKQEPIYSEVVSVRTDAIRLKKFGPFEKWIVYYEDPIYSVRVYKDWFLKFSQKEVI